MLKLAVFLNEKNLLKVSHFNLLLALFNKKKNFPSEINIYSKQKKKTKRKKKNVGPIRLCKRTTATAFLCFNLLSCSSQLLTEVDFISGGYLLSHGCTRAHKFMWYGKSDDQLKENEVKWKEQLQKFDDFLCATAHRQLFRSRQFSGTYMKWILMLLFPLYQRAHITATRGTEYVFYLTKSFALYRNRWRKNLFSKKVIRKISFQTMVFAQNLDERQSGYRRLKTVDFTLLTWTLVY